MRAVVAAIVMTAASQCWAADQIAIVTGAAAMKGRADIVGIKPGMAVEDAKNLLLVYKPRMRIRIANEESTLSTSIHAERESCQTGRAPGLCEEEVRIEAANGDVWYVARSQRFTKGVDAPTPIVFRDAIREKYGALVHHETDKAHREGMHWRWNFNRKGYPMCREDFGASFGCGGDMASVGLMPQVPRSFSQEAGWTFMAYADGTATPGFISTAQVAIADCTIKYGVMVALENRRKGQDAADAAIAAKPRF